MTSRRAWILLLVAALCAVGLRAAWIAQQLASERVQRRQQLAAFAVEVLAADPRGARAAFRTLRRAREGTALLHAGLWLLDHRHEVIDASPEAAASADFRDRRLRWPGSDRSYWDWGGVRADTGVRAFNGRDGPRFLVVHTPPEAAARWWWRLLLQPLLYVVGVAAFVGALVLAYLRRKAAEARSVMARLRDGELSARFVIARDDEVGELTNAFNAMAAEIERLVGEVKQANDARRLLLAELGHDLRTPLTALTNAVETLDRHPGLAESARQRCARIALREARHVHDLIENLMLLSRTDARDHALRRERLDLGELVRDEAESIQELSRDLRIRVEIAADSWLTGDSDLLRRLVRNLLDNAAAHAQAALEVRLQSSQSALELTLDDDGPGLPEWLLRGDPAPESASRKGLGLVIVRRVLQLHEGTIEFANRPGGGANVRVQLPIGVPHGLAQAQRH